MKHYSWMRRSKKVQYLRPFFAQGIWCPQVFEESIFHIKMLILKENDDFKTKGFITSLSMFFTCLYLL